MGIKLLDGQGRLFGKINLLDFCVLLIAILAITTAGVLIFFPNAPRKILVQEAQWVTVDIQILFPSDPVRPQAGDRQMNPEGEPMAEILSVRNADENSGTAVLATVRVKARLWRSDTPAFGNVPLKPGAPFHFNAERYYLEGRIQSVRGPS